MTDPVAQAVVAQPDAATQNSVQQAAGARQFHPSETRMFANLMQGAPQQGATHVPGTLTDAAQALAAQLGGNLRSTEEMRKSLLASVDLSDPIKTMFALTDHTIQAQTMFARLHISTGLASAATSLFGTLLKNQQ